MGQQGPKILVAEDQPVAREAILKGLELSGFQTCWAGDGEEAWGIVQKTEISLLITDIGMPKLDGFQLCRRVKGDPETKFVPVIIVTSADDIRSRIEAYDAGADDILPKPVIKEELVARISNLLRYRRLLEKELEVERERLRLERELALAEIQGRQEQFRNRVYHDVLFAATGGRMELCARDSLNGHLSGWENLVSMTLERESQLQEARALAESSAARSGLSESEAKDVALCVSEAATNGLKFGKQVRLKAGTFEGEFRILVEDDGAGLDHSLLPQLTLQKGFSTGASMGMGFPLMLELMDMVYLASDDEGTTIILSKSPESGEKELDKFLERFSVSLD